MTASIEGLCAVLRDPPYLYDEWRRIVVTNAVSGKKTHDARLVAAMNLHRITQILTFNSEDFQRYAGIMVIEPDSLGLAET